MTICYNEEVSPGFSFSPREVGERVIRQALQTEDFPYEAEVGLTITDDETIHRLNREFRSVDRSTDVLSFPLIDYPAAGDFSEITDESDCFSPESGEAMLGDIVISADHVKSQAAEYGHSELREFAFLVCHSMLHLMGFDHIEEKDRVLMEAEQKKIMDLLNIQRDS